LIEAKKKKQLTENFQMESLQKLIKKTRRNQNSFLFHTPHGKNVTNKHQTKKYNKKKETVFTQKRIL